MKTLIKLLAALTAMTGGCGQYRYPVKVSEKYGITLASPEHLKMEQMEEMIAIAHRLWMQETGVPPASLDGYVVEFLEDSTECGKMSPVPKDKDPSHWSRRCDGVNIMTQKYIGLVEHDCWADTSFVHEILHWWLWKGRPGLDPNKHHFQTEYFRATNSIELRARAIALYDGVCGFVEHSPIVKAVPAPPGHVKAPGE